MISTVHVGSHAIHGTKPTKVLKVIGFVILGIIAAAVLAIVFGLVVKLLWNALIPAIFGLPEISYWQAVGLAVLSHILFGTHHKAIHHKRSRKKCSSEENHVYINGKGVEHHWDSFHEFWKDHGHEAFDNWLKDKQSVED